MSDKSGNDPFNRDPAAVYDRAERLGPLVRRLTVQNPSPMTFTGTQSYIVGEGEVAVIDPGPALPGQAARILGALAPGEEAREALRREVLVAAKRNPKSAVIEAVLLHDSLPVDVRHNAKIDRELLAAWATDQALA